MGITKRENKEQIFNSLNGKRYEELSTNFKEFVKYIYPQVCDTDLITCKMKSSTKIDFIITMNGVSKNIAVQSGNIVLVHKGRVLEFVSFLSSIKVSRNCIHSLLKYHYADGTCDGSSKIINSFGELLSVDYKKEIAIVEKEFKNKELLAKVIDYVLLREKSGAQVDYFYFGDSCRGTYASAERVKYNIVNEKNKYKHRFMRIGVMNYLPLTRNLIYTERGEIERHICILKLNLRRYIKK